MELGQLPKEEFAERLTHVRQAMAAEDLDALLVYSWKRGQVRYVSGYHPNYVANVAMVVLPQKGDPTLLVRITFDVGRARRVSWIGDVRGSGDWAGFVRDCQSILAAQGLDRARIGLVSGDSVVDEMPYILRQGLAESLPRATLVPALSLFDQARMRKSTREGALMAASAKVADLAMAAAAEALAPGRSEYEVAAAAQGTARSLGAEESLFVIADGSTELIRPPEDRLVQAGQMMVLEFAVQVDGYWTQVARVFHVGKPTAEQRDMYSAAYRGYVAGLEAARPGNKVSDVANAELSALEAAGWLEWREYDLGHGDGLDHPELPSITPQSEVRIEPGLVLCIHPGMRKPGVGGVFVGGTVLVREDKAVPLHDIPAEL